MLILSVLNEIEILLKDKIISSANQGGGCIANSIVIETQKGAKYFLKSYGKKKSIHLKEANGLKELSKSEEIRVPEVIAVNENYLLLEYLSTGKRKSSFSLEFGRQLARMHRTTSNKYGFYEDNFIGSNVQKNVPQKSNWVEFYWENRLLYQFKLAEKKGYVNVQLLKDFNKLESRINSIVDGSEEPPTLLHGDLWGGNYMVDENGNPVIIDPAVYYGHREADIAMSKLFGGFDTDFYSAYNEEFTLKADWEYRIDFYNLYHVLNHLNLFGRSYLSQVVSIIRKYNK